MLFARGRGLRRVVPLVAALALVAAGCGGGSSARGHEPPQSLPGAADQVLTKGEVDQYGGDTPQHALLAWWRNAQYANLGGYLGAFEPRLRRDLQRDPKTRNALVWFAGSIRTARPAIENVDSHRDTATIYTRLRYRTPVGTRRFVTFTTPQAFVMMRRAGKWLLRDDSFVQTRIPKSLQHTF